MRLTTAVLCLLFIPLAAGAEEARLERIRTLVDLMEPDGTLRSSIEALLDQQFATETARLDAIAAQSPESAAAVAEQNEQRAALHARIKELFWKHLDFAGYREEVMVPLYARHYTDEDVETLIAFYRSPTGRKMVATLPEVLRESMAASAAYFADASKRVEEELYAEFAARNAAVRTIASMRSLATALEIAAIDEGRYPRVTTVEELRRSAEMESLQEADAWGNAFAIVVAPDGSQYRIVSAGADGAFDAESRTIPPGGLPTSTRLTEGLEGDIILAGTDEEWFLVQVPREVRSTEGVRR